MKPIIRNNCIFDSQFQYLKIGDVFSSTEMPETICVKTGTETSIHYDIFREEWLEDTDCATEVVAKRDAQLYIR